MKLTSMIASALALLSSQTAALAQPPGQGTWVQPDNRYQQAQAPLPAATQVHVVPPPGGVVFLYDGPNMIGRFESEGWTSVPIGRSYGVVMTRGDQRIWSGLVTANGPPIDISWGGYGSYGGQPYAPGPPQPYYQAPPAQPYPPQQPYGYGQAPSIGRRELSVLLRSMDRAYDERSRLDILTSTTPSYWFTTRQAGRVLDRFHSEAYRVLAVASLRDRLVDPESSGYLLGWFTQPATRERARRLLMQ